MYYRHFGLTGAPFQFTPSPKLLFLSKAHREALSALEWGLLHEPSGFTLLIGETGAGKTTLVVSILARNYERLRTAYVTNPKLGFDGMLRDILRQLAVSAPTDKLAMVDAFDRFLAGINPGERVVIIVDEAQSLSDEMLEELRLFSNRGRLDEKQVHFVFVAQPGLLQRLITPELKQINERIGIRSLLNPLERAEASAYVEYRLAAFGSSSAAVFGRGALDYLMDHSGGIPRRINVLCHNSMLTAYNTNQPTVSLEAAREAVAEYENLFSRAKRFIPESSELDIPGQRHSVIPAHTGWPAAMIGSLAIAAAGVFLFWNSGTPRREEPVTVDAASVIGNAVTEHPGNFLPTSIVAAESSSDHADATDNPSGSAERWVRVRPGDTLNRIAAVQLGSTDQVSRLVAANPQLRNANHIEAGQIVHLPPRETTARADGSTNNRSPSAGDWRRVTHKSAGSDE
jgi:general secretion pathway protein A